MSMVKALFQKKALTQVIAEYLGIDRSYDNDACCVTQEALTTPTTKEVIYTKDTTQITYVKNMLTDAESEFLTKAASGCHRSTVVENASRSKTNNARTSSTCAVVSKNNRVMSCIKQKLSHVAESDKKNMEPLQVTRYVDGQQYKPHYDYFTTGHKKGDRQRVTTLFTYLESPGDNCGGETVFPVCDNLQVKPKKGDAVLWRNLLENGNVDTNTLHAGLPVTCKNVEKIGLNVWFGDQPFS